MSPSQRRFGRLVLRASLGRAGHGRGRIAVPDVDGYQDRKQGHGRTGQERVVVGAQVGSEPPGVFPGGADGGDHRREDGDTDGTTELLAGVEDRRGRAGLGSRDSGHEGGLVRNEDQSHAEPEAQYDETDHPHVSAGADPGHQGHRQVDAGAPGPAGVEPSTSGLHSLRSGTRRSRRSRQLPPPATPPSRRMWPALGSACASAGNWPLRSERPGRTSWRSRPGPTSSAVWA